MINQKRRNRAFTLTEIMVSVVIIGILASFGIPSYTKSVRRAKEKDAVFNLRVMWEGVRMFIVRNETVPPPPNPPNPANIADINTMLNLGIIEQEGNTYACLIDAAFGGYRCGATNTDGWNIQVDLDTNNEAVYCTSGNCPTCNATGSSCPK